MEVVESLRDERQLQVDSINAEIDSLLKEQKSFQDTWNLEKYLGTDLYKIFCSYRREDSYTNNNYISDGLSTSECVTKAKELIDAATKELKKACVLQRTVTTDMNNLFALPEFEPLYDKFALFNYIRIRTEDEILKLRLIGIEFSGDSASEITVTFSEQVESIDGKMSDLRSIIKQASSMSTSYPSTVLQAKKGEQAKNTFNEIYSKGLNAAKTMLSNNDHNEVSITSAGIIGKRMDDEGFYGDKQFRITGNMFAFTKDNWRTVELAIGETVFQNPLTGNMEKKYGIFASAIVGEAILGENMGIYSKDKAMIFDASGFRITNNVNSFVVDPSSKTMLSLSNSQGKIFYVDDTGELHIKGNGKALDISANSTISNMSTKIDNNTEDISDEILRATTVESSLSSRLTQTANEIRLEVSKKVDDDELISKINMSSEAIKLSSNRLIVDSNNFSLDENGNVALSGDITGSSGQFTKSFEIDIPVEDSFNHFEGRWIFNADKNGVHMGLISDDINNTFVLNELGIAFQMHELFSTRTKRVIMEAENISFWSNPEISSNIKVDIDGELVVTGAKNRLVKTENYNDRLLYCYETASPFFGDLGHGIIGEDGFCYIDIDSVFEETIDLSHEYYVFLQSYSETLPYVYKKEAAYFVVKGSPGTEFDWELKAKQKDYSTERLEEYVKQDDSTEPAAA